MNLVVSSFSGFKDFDKFKRHMKMFDEKFFVSCIVSDSNKKLLELVEMYQEEINVGAESFTPNFKKDGASAIFKLNDNLIEMADTIIVFHNGKDKKVKDLISKAYKNQINTIIIF